MARLLSTTATRSEEETDTGTRVGGLDLRTAALGAGALTAGYLVGRRLLGAGTPSAGGLRERAGEALPGDGVDVPIGSTGDEDADAGPDEGDVEGAVDPSLEEMDERTNQPTGDDDPMTAVDVEGDASETPAEPGEVQVDEDVVEEAIDDEDEAE